MQRLEENAAVQPDAEEIFSDRRVAQVDERASRRRLAEQPVDACASPDDVRIEAEPAQHVEAGRLDGDPCADRGGIRHALVERHAMPLAGEEDRGRAPGGAAANHPDVERPHSRSSYTRETRLRG
jgi:hypothetical protein